VLYRGRSQTKSYTNKHQQRADLIYIQGLELDLPAEPRGGSLDEHVPSVRLGVGRAANIKLVSSAILRGGPEAVSVAWLDSHILHQSSVKKHECHALHGRLHGVGDGRSNAEGMAGTCTGRMASESQRHATSRAAS
jgi:hypothetical protein